MIIDTNLTITYKCTMCGTFEFFRISLFNLLYKDSLSISCRCKGSKLTILKKNVYKFEIKTPCIACGDVHTYSITKKNVFPSELIAFSCPHTGIQHCFVGQEDKVYKKIDNLERELDEIINMFGYDNYFSNTQVMFDSLNKIHDLAEQKNLVCECGNTDIELLLYPDCVFLNCIKCSGNMIVSALNNEDLNDTLNKTQIVLMSEKVEKPFYKRAKTSKNRKSK